MKITFIKPNIGRREHSLYIDEGRMEPLTLGVLAGLTPPDVEVALYDDRCEQIPLDDQTDLVAMTVETYTARRAYEIADSYRERGVRVILGGMHPSFLPKEAETHADSVFIGDAETLWSQVVEDARKGSLCHRYQAPPGPAQTGGVLPRRELFRDKGYLPITLMQFSRGCRFPCHFCAVTHYFGRNHHIRSVEEVVREIETQERKFIFFVDDNIAANPSSLKELCAAIRPLNINWVSQASLDITKDRTLLSAMEKSGCRGNVMGFESITMASLREAKKAPNFRHSPHYKEEVEILRDHGLQTWAAFTLGFDGDTEKSILATLDFALKNRFTFAAFNLLMPYPGTPFYDQLAQEKRLLYDGQWWLHPTYRFNQAAFVPQNMSADELTNVCHRARKEFNSWASLFYRFSDIKTNLRSLWRAAVFWRYTPLFRKETIKKHGMKFGLK